jgi:hypothetical protein
MSVKENILIKEWFTKEHRTPPEGDCERPEQTGSSPVGFRAQKQ